MEQNLNNRYANRRWWARVDFYVAQAIVALMIGAMFVAVCDYHSRYASGVAGLMLLAEGILQFGQRSRWGYEYAGELDALRNDLIYANVPSEKIAKRLSELVARMERTRPGLNLALIKPRHEPLPGDANH